MALIKCEECGHSISDRATSCPYCGCPIQGNAKTEVKSAEFKTAAANAKANEVKKSDSPKSNGGCLGPFIWAVIIVVLLSMCSIGDSGSSSSNGTCGICGGSGVVTSKILGEGAGVQRGFDMYYRCKGCHGSGRD